MSTADNDRDALRSGALGREAPVPYAEPANRVRQREEPGHQTDRDDDEDKVAQCERHLAPVRTFARGGERAGVHRDRDPGRAPGRVRQERDQFSGRLAEAAERTARDRPAHSSRDAHLRVLVGEERQGAVAGEQGIADAEWKVRVPDEAHLDIGRIGRPSAREREHPERETAKGGGQPEAQTCLGRAERSDRPGRRLVRRREDGVAPHEADAKQAERHEGAGDRREASASTERRRDRDGEEEERRHRVDDEEEKERDRQRHRELHRWIASREDVHARTSSRVTSASRAASSPVTGEIELSRAPASANASATGGSASPNLARSARARSSAGVPSKPILPSAIASARSASSATSERSCVMTTIVVPAARSSRRSATSSRVFRRSWPKVGSSRMRTLGLVTRALATESRRFSPCESECGFVSARRASPNRSSRVSGSRASRPPTRAA